jgi:hypothetical protein
MDAFDLLVTMPLQQLSNLDGWIAKANQFASERKFDANVLLSARLFPDQFPLVRQIQSACDSAKGNAGRLAGKDLPSHPDTEATFEELSARIQKVRAYLKTFQASDFADCATRKVSLGWMQGKHVLGADYLSEFAIPNFHFHLVTSYSILRHSGVPLGKFDYIGKLTMRD